MTQVRRATIFERIRGYVYNFASYPVVAIVSFALSYYIHKKGLMNVIIKNASTLAVTGAALAAFIFTIQSVLISVPKENPFMRHIRNDRRYLIYLHRFCLVSEIAFVVIMLPMFYMSKKRPVLNIIVFAVFIGSLIYTLWSMCLMCRILIDCEKFSDG